jgi:hypothetical protein
MLLRAVGEQRGGLPGGQEAERRPQRINEIEGVAMIAPNKVEPPWTVR